MEPGEPRPRRFGRREALGLGILGAAGAGTAAVFAIGGRDLPRSSRLAAPAAAQPHRHVPSPPASSAPPVPAAPVAVRSTPIRKISELLPGAPANAVALTIDDGPHPEWTPRVLDLLAHYEVTATFCLIGEQIRANEKEVAMMVAAGHQVANHTWTHPLNINHLSRTRVDTEIERTYRQIVEVTGKNPHLFRAPGGNWSHAVYAATAQHGMYPLDWQVDPRDWSRPGTSRIIYRMLTAQPGDVLLCHDGGGDRSETIRALRTVIPQLKSRGLQFITLQPPGTH